MKIKSFMFLAFCLMLLTACGGGVGQNDDTLSVESLTAPSSVGTSDERADDRGIFDERGNLAGVATRPYDPCEERACEDKEEEETPQIRRETSVLWPAKRR